MFLSSLMSSLLLLVLLLLLLLLQLLLWLCRAVPYGRSTLGLVPRWFRLACWCCCLAAAGVWETPGSGCRVRVCALLFLRCLAAWPLDSRRMALPHLCTLGWGRGLPGHDDQSQPRTFSRCPQCVKIELNSMDHIGARFRARATAAGRTRER